MLETSGFADVTKAHVSSTKSSDNRPSDVSFFAVWALPPDISHGKYPSSCSATLELATD
jgi:hypothetical protein